MVHPDFVVAEAELANMPAIQPVYPLTEGLTAQALRRAIGAAVERVPALPEWLDPPLVAREKWPSFADALRTLHRPAEPTDLAWQGPAWSRLAYDEMLAGQLALALVRAQMGRRGGRVRAHTADLQAKIIAALPFTLTGSQVKALADINADLGAPATHAAPAPGRCRLRQDRRRAARRRRRDRVRRPGRADGAD